MAARERILLENLVRSLTIRLIGLFGAVVVVLVFTGSILANGWITTQEKLQLEKADVLGTNTARFVASTLFPYLQFEQIEGIEKLVAETRASTSNCVYAAVVDEHMKVIAASPNDFVPPKVSNESAETGISIKHANLSVRHFAAGVGRDKTPKHFFLVGIDLTTNEGRTSELETKSITTTAIALLVSTLILLAVTWFIFRRARSVNHVADRMRESDGIVSATTQEIRASASEILTVAKHTEMNATDEAASVDETRRTMHALLEASNEISEGARSVAEIAEKSASASGVIAERIAVLRAQALKITDVSETIQAIADKSDILALNASLEGAKAGESGRGFVLVGTEMRRLAETIMDAVREIKHLAKEIRDLSQAAVLATEEGAKLSRETTETAKRITLITSQQRTGTEQVSQSMDEIQQFTQQSLAGAKQAQATADNLASTAEDLNNILEGKPVGQAPAT